MDTPFIADVTVTFQLGRETNLKVVMLQDPNQEIQTSLTQQGHLIWDQNLTPDNEIDLLGLLFLLKTSLAEIGA